jgi:hypothetical protein
MKVGDGNREEPGRKVQQKKYRRWSVRTQVRLKWWGKSPPRPGRPGRQCKPRAVQDRTGEGLPVRYKPRVLVAFRASGTLRSGGVREMAVQSRVSGRDRIRLTGGRHPRFFIPSWRSAWRRPPSSPDSTMPRCSRRDDSDSGGSRRAPRRPGQEWECRVLHPEPGLS